MRKYCTWNYVEGVWREYERYGKCNQCGDCCKYVMYVQWNGDYEYPDVDIVVAFFDDTGGTSYGIRELGVYLPCGDLYDIDGDCYCTQYNGDRKICNEFPMCPEHIADFPNCGYKFVEINRGSIKFQKVEKYGKTL